MSFPTSSFSRLSLSTMPSASAKPQEERHNRAHPDTSESDDSNISADESEIERDEFITSLHTNLSYDASQLTPRTESRLRAGLRKPLTLGHVSVYNAEQRDEYLAFQIFETVNFSVRVGASSSGYPQLTCHCDENTSPCRHVFWLLDQIAQHTLSGEEKKQPLQLRSNGLLLINNETAYSQITAAGPAFFDELGCELRRPGADDEHQGQNDRRANRADQVRDMLASFSAVSRDSFRPDIFDELPAADEPTFFAKDLEKTLALSMLKNDDLFRHMRALASTSHCASDYFRKKRAESTKALEQLDVYTRTRPKSNASNIAATAETISNIVEQIVRRLNNARTPLSTSALQTAAETLSLLLRDLSARNIDIYDSSIWARSREQTLPLKDRNLFYRFYGTAPSGSGRFIIDDLADLGDAVKPFVQVLEDVREAFERNKAMKTYVDKLAWLVGSLKGRERAGSMPGLKRVGGEGEERGSKRVK